MIRIHFKEQEVQALRHERFHNSSVRVQQKMEALFLKSKGLAHQEICRLCEISKPTLVAYLKEYQRGGIQKMKESARNEMPAHRTDGSSVGYTRHTSRD